MSHVSDVKFRTRFDGYKTDPEGVNDFHHAIVKEGYDKTAVYSTGGELKCVSCPDNECRHVRAVYDHLPTQASEETMRRLGKIAANHG